MNMNRSPTAASDPAAFNRAVTASTISCLPSSISLRSSVDVSVAMDRTSSGIDCCDGSGSVRADASVRVWVNGSHLLRDGFPGRR